MSPERGVAQDGAARPLRADARRNRARILDAARAAFAAEGMAIPLDEIARRAGVGPGTLHRHFPTKESLFEVVVLDDVERLTRQARSLMEAGNPGAALLEFLCVMAEEVKDSRAVTDALSGAGLSVHADIMVATQALHEALGLLLVRAQDAGALRTDIGPRDLMALLVGICLAAERVGRERDVLPRLMAVVSDGLRRR